MNSSNPTVDRPQLVVAIFGERTAAEQAVQTLQQRGFTQEQLSILLRHDEATVTSEELTALDQEAEATGTDVAVGSVVGGLAGLLGGLALFSIPGLGPFLGYGVLATTFGGAALGSALGERAAHHGPVELPAQRTERYQSALSAGSVVLAVIARDAQEVMQARETLALHEPDEIDVYPQGLPSS